MLSTVSIFARMTISQRQASAQLLSCACLTLLGAIAAVASAEEPAAQPTNHLSAQQPAGEINFDRQIRPLLANTCFHCHGPDEANRSADLRLDQEEAAKEYVIVPGDVQASELINRITETDPNLRMPPPDAKRQLTAEQIGLLRRWVAEGAPWTAHWAYTTPERPKLPKVESANSKSGDWPKNSIDYFVLAKLAEHQLAPSERANRATLLRRVTLDLTGLPPSLAELNAFLADEAPNAYEQRVDRLLASPRYGEHMAQPWLAAARYADTNGYQQDATRTSWPWRDWVINAMNNNMPFDRFTIEQLAGDLLPNPTHQQLVASGFHRNHALNGEGGRNPEESRVEYVIDRASTTGTVWMGLTVGCARCHDHKYDEVSQKEFYQLYAYFNHIDERGNVDAGGNAKPVHALPTDEQLQQAQVFQQRIAELEKQIAAQPTSTPEEQQNWQTETRDWLNKIAADELWQLPKQLSLTCKHEVKSEQLEDGSVLVKQMANSGDTYEITIDLPEGFYHGLRIEAFRHPQLVQGQFSHGVKGGFSVTDLEVKLGDKPIQLASAETNHGGQTAAEGLLDTNKYTTWSVGDPGRAPQVPTWIGHFEKPLVSSAGGKLVVSMKHESRTGDAPIGRFRISFTAFPQPTLKPNLGLPQQTVAALHTPTAKMTPQQVQLLKKQNRIAQTAPLRKQIGEIQEQLKKHQERYLATMVMRDRKQPRDTYLLKSGLWNAPDKSEKLHPATLACLPPMPEDEPTNRLALARWLVRPDHPLTARVIVNRYWLQFFGVGIVRTVGDFGVQGERPSHPLLLDWLATEFIESGWDVKHLHKLIVMSATYQQSSAATPELIEGDPFNWLLTRGPRKRLSAQALRDQTLALSGLLVNKLGGPGVKPYQPEGVWSDFSLGKIKYQRDKGDKLYRRSVYTFWRRSVGPTLFFDNPARQVCTVRLSLTNTPLHALTLLNDVTYIEAARVLAERVMTSAPSTGKLPTDAEPTDKQRIGLAFRIATLRYPNEAEQATLQRTLNDLRQQYQADPAGAAKLIQVGDHPTDASLDATELAAYTSLMNVILNLDEVVNKG